MKWRWMPSSVVCLFATYWRVIGPGHFLLQSGEIVSDCLPGHPAAFRRVCRMWAISSIWLRSILVVFPCTGVEKSFRLWKAAMNPARQLKSLMSFHSSSAWRNRNSLMAMEQKSPSVKSWPGVNISALIRSAIFASSSGLKMRCESEMASEL